MVTLLSPSVAFLFVFLIHQAFAFVFDGAIDHQLDASRASPHHVRSLRAAKKSGKLSQRDVKGCLSHDHHLHYLDCQYMIHHNLTQQG